MMRADKGICVLVAVSLSIILSCGVAPANEKSANDDFDSGEDFALKVLKPTGPGPFPTVLMLHGCAGLTPAVVESLHNHAAVLTEAGYLVAILDSFSRREKGGGRVCRSLDELGYARYYRVKDVYGAMARLAPAPYVDARNFFVIGQSNGGSVALALAAGAEGTGAKGGGDHEIRAIVAFYPWCGTLHASPVLQIPLLVLGAGQDDWVSPEGCRHRAASATGAVMEVVVYDEARHSFDLPIEKQVYEGHVVEGAEEPTRDSRVRILDFFKRFLAP